MNQNAVLMCYNIPYEVKEELLYDLFCNAGPIQSLHYGKSGKSVFVVYEFEEAVATAKEIFKDVKLRGHSIRMFDKEEIENIYARQEEEVNRKRRYEVDNDRYGPPMKHRRFDENPRRSNYHVRFHSPDPEFPRGSSYQDTAGYHSEERPSHHGRYSAGQNYQNTNPANREYSKPGIPSNLGYRPDLVPSTSSNSQNGSRRHYDSGMNGDEFRNPYEKSVSRYDNREQSYRYEDVRNRKFDKPYDRRDHRNGRRSRSPPPRNQYRNRGHQNYSYKSRRH